jgi:predicted RNase H-like HicB family nuclease
MDKNQTIMKKTIMKKTIRLSVILYKEEDGYIAEEPVLGMVTQGDTFEEALANIKEVVQLEIEEMEADGEEVPTKTGPIYVRTIECLRRPDFD